MESNVQSSDVLARVLEFIPNSNSNEYKLTNPSLGKPIKADFKLENVPCNKLKSLLKPSEQIKWISLEKLTAS